MEEAVPAALGSVLVDVGGDIGLLVVLTDAALEGEEIEIQPLGAATRTHTVVRPRELPAGGVVYAGVFPSLPAGDYVLVAQDGHPEQPVHVAGGVVTEVTW